MTCFVLDNRCYFSPFYIVVRVVRGNFCHHQDFSRLFTEGRNELKEGESESEWKGEMLVFYMWSTECLKCVFKSFSGGVRLVAHKSSAGKRGAWNHKLMTVRRREWSTVSVDFLTASSKSNRWKKEKELFRWSWIGTGERCKKLHSTWRLFTFVLQDSAMWLDFEAIDEVLFRWVICFDVDRFHCLPFKF